ncbi:TlpA family protein disulfide reductase [Ferruginibacter sp.]
MKKNVLFLFIIIFSLISIAFFIAVSYLGKFSFNIKIFVGTIAYFAGTFFALKNIKAVKASHLFLIILLPVFAFFLIVNVFDYRASVVSFPSNAFIIISIISGYLFFLKKNLLVPILLSLFTGSWLLYFQEFYLNKRNYGTFTKTVHFKNPAQLFYDSSGNKVIIPAQAKTVVLDFWNSNCGACYDLFPFIDSINKITDTSKIKIYTVNVPIRNEKMANNYHKLDKFKYTFSQLFVEDDKILDFLQIKYFPTAIVVKNEIIVFRGDFESAIAQIKTE